MADSSGCKRVILVDDDRGVLTAMERLLRANGWEPKTYFDPVTFLSDVLDDPSEIFAVISDIEMPSADGPTVVARAIALRPEIRARVAFMTGGATATLMARAEALGPVIFKSESSEIVGFLRKLNEERRTAP